MNSILHPATPYAFLAVGMGLCLYLFGTLKRDLRTAERRLNERCQKSDEMAQKLRSTTDQLKEGLEEAQERAGVLVAPTPPRSGLNLSKRSHVLRMSRRGDAPEKIATVLSLPQNEVDLLLKVHRMLLDRLDAPATVPGGAPDEPSAGTGIRMAVAPKSR